MKKVMIGMAILLASGQVIAQKNKQVQAVEVPAANTEVKTGKVSKERKVSVSYLIGLSIGQNITKEMSVANWKLLVKGIQDVFENKSLQAENDLISIISKPPSSYMTFTP